MLGFDAQCHKVAVHLIRHVVSPVVDVVSLYKDFLCVFYHTAAKSPNGSTFMQGNMYIPIKT